MLQSYTLSTAEIDYVEEAVKDIQTQLARLTLCKNTVGILVCHYDFVECGVVPALKDALPFPLVGITTFYQHTPRGKGLFELTVTVLTSDTVCFALACGTQAETSDAACREVRSAYRRAYQVHARPPALILSFLSANRPVSGDQYLRQLDEASGGVPSFGMVNSGEDETGANIYVICDGQAFSSGVAMLLLIGEVAWRTYINDTPESHLLAVSSTATATEGALVKEINGQPAAAYLQKQGVSLQDIAAGDISTLSFYFRAPRDEAFVGRTLKTVTPQGALEFMGDIREGSLLRVGIASSKDLLQESYAVTQKAVREAPDAAIFLIASCVGRFITLGLDTTAEMDHALQVFGGNYLACYVGGEICPLYSGGTMVNRYHNNSFIVLALG